MSAYGNPPGGGSTTVQGLARNQVKPFALATGPGVARTDLAGALSAVVQKAIQIDGFDLTGTELQFTSADGTENDKSLEAGIHALMQVWARAGSAVLIPPEKLGTGTGGSGVVLHRDGTWQPLPEGITAPAKWAEANDQTLIPVGKMGTGTGGRGVVLHRDGTWQPLPDGDDAASWAEANNADPIPPAKLGTGAASDATVLVGDGQWKSLATLVAGLARVAAAVWARTGDTSLIPPGKLGTGAGGLGTRRLADDGTWQDVAQGTGGISLEEARDAVAAALHQGGLQTAADVAFTNDDANDRIIAEIKAGAISLAEMRKDPSDTALLSNRQSWLDALGISHGTGLATRMESLDTLPDPSGAGDGDMVDYQGDWWEKVEDDEENVLRGTGGTTFAGRTAPYVGFEAAGCLFRWDPTGENESLAVLTVPRTTIGGSPASSLYAIAHNLTTGQTAYLLMPRDAALDTATAYGWESGDTGSRFEAAAGEDVELTIWTDRWNGSAGLDVHVAGRWEQKKYRQAPAAPTDQQVYNLLKRIFVAGEGTTARFIDAMRQVAIDEAPAPSGSELPAKPWRKDQRFTLDQQITDVDDPGVMTPAVAGNIIGWRQGSLGSVDRQPDDTMFDGFYFYGSTGTTPSLRGRLVVEGHKAWDAVEWKGTRYTMQAVPLLPGFRRSTQTFTDAASPVASGERGALQGLQGTLKAWHDRTLDAGEVIYDGFRWHEVDFHRTAVLALIALWAQAGNASRLPNAKFIREMTAAQFAAATDQSGLIAIRG